MSVLSRYNLNSAFLLQHLIQLFLNPRNLWPSAQPVSLHGSKKFLLSFWEFCQYTSLPLSDATVLLHVYVLFHLDQRNVRPFLLMCMHAELIDFIYYKKMLAGVLLAADRVST